VTRELNTPFVRVLIVDDFDPWRGFVIEHLRQQPNLLIIGFASDGLEAVQKAEELQPDLILLDIGLPKLDGIEVAGQIRKLAPKSKMLFVSSDSDPAVVRAAFYAGGHGYVLKTDATIALLPGMEAVLLGERFVSPGITEVDDWTDAGE
jgi:DNA-binding NarL/FixJ family response regulator